MDTHGLSTPLTVSLKNEIALHGRHLALHLYLLCVSCVAHVQFGKGVSDSLFKFFNRYVQPSHSHRVDNVWRLTHHTGVVFLRWA